jgi:hypothetical protein
MSRFEAIGRLKLAADFDWIWRMQAHTTIRPKSSLRIRVATIGGPVYRPFSSKKHLERPGSSRHFSSL